MNIRLYQHGDLEEMRRITIEGFDGTAIDQNVERNFGTLSGHDWRWRKARQVDEDCEVNPAGVFVMEEDGKVLGYITTRVDHVVGKGRIPNLAVDSNAQGRGIGRKLIERAIEYCRGESMEYVMIETMANNVVGQHLYPSCGFVEVGQQIHYAMKV